MAEQIITLQIEGMTCDGCAQGIRYALKRQKGVKTIKIDWRGGMGEVTFDTADTSEQDILENPVFAGHYKASLVPGRACC